MKRLILILMFLALLISVPGYALEKNTASQKWVVFCFDETTNIETTGDAAQITGNVRIDGAAANAIDDVNPTELEDGYYIFDITAAESNGDSIVIAPASSTGSVQCIGCPPALYTVAPDLNSLTIANSSVNSNIKYVGDDAIVDNADGRLEVNVEEIVDVAVSTTTAQLGVNAVNAGGTAWGSGAITAASIATDAIGAAEIAANAIGASEIAAAAIDAATYAADMDTEIATIVWNAATVTYGGAGTYGQAAEDTLADTDVIGAAGAGLTGIPWNAAWDAEAQSEATDALTAYDPPTKAELDTAQGAVTLANGAHGGAAAAITLADYSNFQGAAGSDRLLLVDTTIATLATQTSFTLTAGSADDNAYRNCTIVIEDSATAAQKAVGLISAYTGATKTITLKYDPAVFTMQATDKVYVLAENALKSTAVNTQLDVTATGAAGIDWANVENPTTAVDLSATDIQLSDTVTTYTGNTPQTADHAANITAIKLKTDRMRP